MNSSTNFKLHGILRCLTGIGHALVNAKNIDGLVDVAIESGKPSGWLSVVIMAFFYGSISTYFVLGGLFQLSNNYKRLRILYWISFVFFILMTFFGIKVMMSSGYSPTWQAPLWLLGYMLTFYYLIFDFKNKPKAN